IWFKIKMDTPLGKLMGAYCRRQDVTMEAVRFLFDNKRLGEEQTPADVGMADGDGIETV
ncbi:ubiquitin-related domain-containing protein, partial [Pavlovales sp. CCMP2436]